MNPSTVSAIKPTLNQTVQSLMTGPVGKTRQKGIITLAKRKNISRDDARFNQSVRIAQSKQRTHKK